MQLLFYPNKQKFLIKCTTGFLQKIMWYIQMGKNTVTNTEIWNKKQRFTLSLEGNYKEKDHFSFIG